MAFLWAVGRRLLFLLARRLEVLGEVAQDHLVERFVADEIFAEDRAPLLRSRLAEDRSRARGSVATLGRRFPRRRSGRLLRRSRRGLLPRRARATFAARLSGGSPCAVRAARRA